MQLKVVSVVCLCMGFVCARGASPIGRTAVTGLASVEHGPWAGAVTATSAVVKVRVTMEGVAVRLSVGAGGGGQVFFTEPQQAPRSRIVAFELKNLKPTTHYLYNVEVNGRFDRTTLGQFTTFSEGAASFTFAFASCARTASSHLVFRTIREDRPLFFMNVGDFHYLNINSDSPEKFYAAYDEVLSSPLQAELYRNLPFVYIWDDHDYGGNNSSRTAASHSAARAVYNDYVPHYPLPAGERDAPIYQAFSVGRARFILTDLRSERTPDNEKDTPAKTMMGPQQ